MERKFERLLLGYVIVIIMIVLGTLFLKIIPNNALGSILFISATLYYPAKVVGDNLHKVVRWLKKL